MAYSSTNMSHPLYGFNKQDKNDIITVGVTEEIRPSVRLKANRRIAVDTGTEVGFDANKVPQDQINCGPIKCLNTGTLFVKHANKKAKVRYQIRSHPDKYALGFNMIYLNLPKAGTYTLRAKVSDYADATQTNSFTYAYKFAVTAPGEVLRTVDFTDIVSLNDTANGGGQTGTGWYPEFKSGKLTGKPSAKSAGITISYEVEASADTELEETAQIGFSSIYIVGDRSELRKFSNVLLSCLTSFTHNVSVPASDARCFGRQYDAEQIEVTKEITATTTSANDYWLNPLESVSNLVTSGIPQTDTYVVDEVTVDGKKYGEIYLPDLYFGDCNTIIISLDRCESTYLSMLPVSPGVSLRADEFIVITDQKLATPRGTVLVSEDYIGEEVLVTYNAEREVELIVANDKRLDKTHFRVTQHVKDTKGNDRYYVFNNVLITENSREYGTDSEVTLSLTLTISRDDNGNFYEVRKDSGDLA